MTLGDLSPIRRAVERWRPSLLVLDPLSGYLGGDVDLHRANEVRPRMAALAALAQEYGFAALVIRHLSKAPAGRAIYPGLGSIDITAAARSVLLAGQDPANPEQRAIVPIKASLAPMGPALGYELGADGFRWCGLSDLTAGALLAPEGEGDARSSVEEAAEYLRGALADGARPARLVQKEARAAGISLTTMKRARATLGVRAKRASAAGGSRGAGEWLLYIPVGPLGPLEEVEAPQRARSRDQGCQHNLEPAEEEGIL